MGTVFLFQIQDPVPESELEHHVGIATEILRDADEKFSLYKPDSEISKLVREEIQWRQASPVQQSIRSQAQQWREITQGYFDSRDGKDYDPSGLVKGWAAQNAANYLEANGITNFTLNAGGDIYLSSELQPSVLSRVGMSNLKPIYSKDAGVNMVLELAGTDFHAVATSGIAERGEHIWRAESSRQFQQVSVVAGDLITADVWATALLSGGDKAWQVFQGSAAEVPALGVFEDGSMVATARFSALLASF